MPPTYHLIFAALHVLYTSFISMLMWIGNSLRVQSELQFYHGDKSTELTLNGCGACPLHVLLREQVPALFRPYTPTWWMPLGDMQTVYSSVFHRRKNPRVHYERKFIIVPDGGCISMDITPPISPEVPADTPIVIVLHGLLGGSHVSYVRSVVAPLTKPTKQGGLGIRVVVFNLRGCSKTPVTSPLLYHPGMTDDLRSVVLYVSSQYPNAKLFGLGFSLGAGYLTNYLGEEGDQSPLIAGFNVSNVWDYSACSLELSDGRFLSKVLYNPVIGKGHQRVIKKNRHAFGSHSELENLLIKRLPTMSWFTAQFMSQTAGVDPLQFLHDTSCAKSIAGIRIPLLCLNARDDPLLPESYLPVKQVRDSEHVMMVVTERGGHLGWFESAQDDTGEFEPWYTPAILEYFKMFLQAQDTVRRPSPSLTEPDERGVIHQAGRPNVGFREVSSEEVFEIVSGIKGEQFRQASAKEKMKSPPAKLSRLGASNSASLRARHPSISMPCVLSFRTSP